jgi:hypothetical protein
MTDSHEDDERPEPVLVRPYVKPLPDKPARDPADAPTVVQPVIEDETETLPVVPPPPRRRGVARPLALRLLALIVGVAVALAVAGWLIFRPVPDTTQPGAALPQYQGGLPTGAAVKSPPRSPSLSPSVTISPTTSPTPGSSASVSISAAATSASAPSGTPSEPPPATDRTGTIRAASGRCLALGGLLGLDGSPVQVAGCADLPVQRFTLGADGTLQVGGRCAEATGDATVRIAACGDASSGQWRAGPDGTLVNAAAGQCLTDPGRAGATTRVAACGGGDDQRWTLP